MSIPIPPYTTLEGNTIHITALPVHEQAFYLRLKAYYETNPAHVEFSRRWRVDGHQVWRGKDRQLVADSPIFAVCQDLDARVAIREGHLGTYKS
ncbi:MAG TPA: hypothetical protein VLJ21_04680 [Candidatus Binatia bacterium]|nr:hypothetical protein [Candidatus Binatia bacterium]